MDVRPTEAAPAWFDDPIVAKVRAAREALWEEAGHDFDRLMAMIRSWEAEERAAGREFLPSRAA